MRKHHLPITIASALLLFTISAFAQSSESKWPAPTRELKITAQGGEEAWDSSIADVEKVCHSAASELWKHFPDKKLHPILVAPKGGPIVLFRRGDKGEYLVRLNTGSNLWAQMSYQFSHEFMHILCGYVEADTGNLWFEESLCELASLYSLRQMAITWKTNPPYSNWKDYAEKLGDYASERIKASPLPDNMTLAQWYAKEAESLRTNPTQREKNNIFAVAILPLIEKDPSQWASVEFLNLGRTKEPRSFARYLSDWHQNVPEKHKEFVQSVATQLGVKLEKVK